MSVSTATYPTLTAGVQREVKWIEGLRGIAAICIVTFHLATGYWVTLLSPAQDQQSLGSILHLPLLRLPAAGQAWVAVFLTLTGYVAALRPVTQARNGEIARALSTLTSATLKRPARLILPSTAATIMSWIMAQMGAFRMGKASGILGIYNTSPLPSESFSKAFQDLGFNIFTTWSSGENLYDHHQWAMMYILLGSMMVFLTLLATIRCSPLGRVTVFVGLYAFNWAKAQPIYMNLYSGAALAELGIISTHWNHHNLDRLHIRIASYALILVGLFLCSCPVRDPEWTTWSRALYHTGWHIFPKVVTHQTDYWGSVGTLFLLLGLICAPSAQRQLSCRPMLWLGSISLPVYLFHGPLMRSVLIWALLGWKKAEGDVSQGAQKPQIPQTWLICVCIPIYFVILFATSQAWNLYVEPWCAWLTNKLVEYMFGNGAEYAKRKAAEGDEAKEGLLMGQV